MSDNKKKGEGPGSGKAGPEEKRKGFARASSAVAIICAVALGAAVGVGAVALFSSAQNAKDIAALSQAQQQQPAATAQQPEAQVQNAGESTTPGHVHTWVPRYTTVHHDAVYDQVWHEPVYRTETTYHTVCNECDAVIDGYAAAHIEDTGHSGYSTQVPVENEAIAQAGYFEPVLVQDSYDEVITDGVVCSGCGSVQGEGGETEE